MERLAELSFEDGLFLTLEFSESWTQCQDLSWSAKLNCRLKYLSRITSYEVIENSGRVKQPNLKGALDRKCPGIQYRP